MKKPLQIIVITIIILLQSLFLGAIMLENFHNESHLNTIIILFILLLLGLAYKKIPTLHHKMDYEDVKVILWVPVGAILTYFLAVNLQFGAILAASLVGTSFSILPSMFKTAYVKKIPIAVYCGAFVGMSSIDVAQNIWFVLISGVIAGFFLMLAKSLFLGLGGKLGMLAFASVVITYFVFYMFS